MAFSLYDTVANSIYNSCYKQLSKAECQYLVTCQARTSQYVACQSASEMVLLFAINCATASLNVLDYLYIFTYVALHDRDTNPETGCNEKVNMLLDVIDNYDLLDQAMKNRKFIKLLVRTLYELGDEDSPYAYCILAHVFKKFPGWLKDNFMRYKWKGKTYYIFSQEDIDKYF